LWLKIINCHEDSKARRNTKKYKESEIIRNLTDIDLVRGPAVFLNAKLDIILQGLLAQAASKSKRFVPLRAAIAAKGL